MATSVVINIYSFVLINDLKDKNNSLNIVNENYQNELFTLQKKYEYKIKSSASQKELIAELKSSKNAKQNNKNDISLKKLAENIDNFYVPSMLIPESIDNMSEEELKENLTRFLKFKEDDLPSNMSLKQFINKLIKIAMVDDLSDDQEIHISQEQKKFQIVKPLPTDPNELLHKNSGEESNSKVDNSKFNNKMYTTLDLRGVDSERVLLKWVNKDSNKVLSYSYMNVSPNEVNTISLEQKDNWEKGSYEAKIFTTDNEITQIASTIFIVE